MAPNVKIKVIPEKYETVFGQDLSQANRLVQVSE